MKPRGGLNIGTGKETPNSSSLPLSDNLYAVDTRPNYRISIRKLRRQLPAWVSLKRVGREEASREKYPVGSYVYVQLEGDRGRAPAMVLEKRQLSDGRRLCLSAWLYNRTDANLTASQWKSTWPRGRIYVTSTHLQVLDYDTLDGLLESALCPNRTNVLDLRSGKSILRHASSPLVDWLSELIGSSRQDRGMGELPEQKSQSSSTVHDSVPNPVFEPHRRGIKIQPSSFSRSNTCDTLRAPRREGSSTPMLYGNSLFSNRTSHGLIPGVDGAIHLDRRGVWGDKLRECSPQEMRRAIDTDLDNSEDASVSSELSALESGLKHRSRSLKHKR
jgi:hypothetical protein